MAQSSPMSLFHLFHYLVDACMSATFFITSATLFIVNMLSSVDFEDMMKTMSLVPYHISTGAQREREREREGTEREGERERGRERGREREREKEREREGERERKKERKRERDLFVGWLLNVPATG